MSVRRVKPDVVVYTACGAAAAAHGLYCYSPQQLQSAYGVSPLLAHRVNGRGETVVLPEAAFPPQFSHRLPAHEGLYLRESLRAYDILYRLPRFHLTVNDSLGDGSPPDRAASEEELLDVEMVHAMAPSAHIVVDLVAGDLPARLPAIMRLAAHQGRLVSFSYGTGESCVRYELRSIQSSLATASRHGISVFASAGDSLDMTRKCRSGGLTGRRSLTMPASDPLVTAVGGTQLSVAASGAYAGETVWNQQQQLGHGGPVGTGGGFSALFRRPSYQAGVPGIGRRRGVPDVAFSASEVDGVAVVSWVEGRSGCSLTHHGGPRRCVIVRGVGGTSVGSPAWAGIGALADQYAHRGLGFLDPAIYSIARRSAYPAAFHDVTVGNNSSSLHGRAILGFAAGAGWDPCTGWGSPNASVLVPLLAAHRAPHHSTHKKHKKHKKHRR